MNTDPLIELMSTEDKGRFLELIIKLKKLVLKINSCKTMNELKDLYVNEYFPVISELATQLLDELLYYRSVGRI